MKNRRDTGVFLRIYHRSDLKSRSDSSLNFSIPFRAAERPLDSLFPDRSDRCSRSRTIQDGISLKFDG